MNTTWFYAACRWQRLDARPRRVVRSSAMSELKKARGPPFALYTRSPLEDSRLFGPSPWKILAAANEQKHIWGTQPLAKILLWRPGACMYACMYVCMCIYIYTHNIYIYIYTYICIYIYIYVTTTTTTNNNNNHNNNNNNHMTKSKKRPGSNTPISWCLLRRLGVQVAQRWW